MVNNAITAALFLELGLGAMTGGCIEDGSGCSQDPLGVAAVGYETGPWVLRLDHYSSIHDQDRGADVVSVRYRFTFD